MGRLKYKWSIRKRGDDYIEVVKNNNDDDALRTTFYIPAIRSIRTNANFEMWRIIINSGQMEEDEWVCFFNNSRETNDFYDNFLYLLTGTVTPNMICEAANE